MGNRQSMLQVIGDQTISSEELSNLCVMLSQKGFSSFSQYVVLPGFCDVHVHLREPGFSYKETIASGTAAAAKGGFTDVMCMPNLNPVPDSMENLQILLDLIQKDACIGVHPYGAITVGEKGEELADMAALHPFCLAFSDDGRGVQDAQRMEQAMREAKKHGRILAAHCEDDLLRAGGYIHDGVYAKAHGHCGISSKSEYLPILRDIDLAEKTGCAYHVCHVSAKESVEAIRQAKKRGIDITCETAPHYLVLCEEDLQEDGRFKMNPPLRGKEDREALIQGILDGTIDMIATDHAPHSAKEKAGGLKDSLMGIVGLETAFPVLYTELVKTNLLSLEKLIDLLCYNPRKRFGIPQRGYSVWDLNACERVDLQTFLSKGKSTPFQDRMLYGKCLLTRNGGQTVWQK